MRVVPWFHKRIKQESSNGRDQVFPSRLHQRVVMSFRLHISSNCISQSEISKAAMTACLPASAIGRRSQKLRVNALTPSAPSDSVLERMPLVCRTRVRASLLCSHHLTTPHQAARRRDEIVILVRKELGWAIDLEISLSSIKTPLIVHREEQGPNAE